MAKDGERLLIVCGSVVGVIVCMTVDMGLTSGISAILGAFFGALGTYESLHSQTTGTPTTTREREVDDAFAYAEAVSDA